MAIGQNCFIWNGKTDCDWQKWFLDLCIGDFWPNTGTCWHKCFIWAYAFRFLPDSSGEHRLLLFITPEIDHQSVTCGESFVVYVWQFTTNNYTFKMLLTYEGLLVLLVVASTGIIMYLPGNPYLPGGPDRVHSCSGPSRHAHLNLYEPNVYMHIFSFLH